MGGDLPLSKPMEHHNQTLVVAPKKPVKLSKSREFTRKPVDVDESWNPFNLENTVTSRFLESQRTNSDGFFQLCTKVIEFELYEAVAVFWLLLVKETVGWSSAVSVSVSFVDQVTDVDRKFGELSLLQESGWVRPEPEPAAAVAGRPRRRAGAAGAAAEKKTRPPPAAAAGARSNLRAHIMAARKNQMAAAAAAKSPR